MLMTDLNTPRSVLKYVERELAKNEAEAPDFDKPIVNKSRASILDHLKGFESDDDAPSFQKESAPHSSGRKSMFVEMFERPNRGSVLGRKVTT